VAHLQQSQSNEFNIVIHVLYSMAHIEQNAKLWYSACAQKLVDNQLRLLHELKTKT